MATFKTRIEGLTGLSIDGSSNPTQVEVSQFLTDGVNDIINRLQMINPGAAAMFATQTAVGSSGSYIDGDILGVYGNEALYSRPATEIPAIMKGLVQDSNSLNYQSAYNPVFYREGKKVTILPSGGSVIHITKPSVDHSDETILEVPEQYYHLVCMYASIQSMRNAMAGKDSSLPSYTEPGSLPVPSFSSALPVDLTVPNFPYISTSLESVTGGTSIVRTDIDANIPIYIAPALDIQPLTSINDITLPAIPTAPVVADTTISFDPNVDKPVFNKPSLVLPTFSIDSDFSLTGTAASPPSAPIAPNMTAETIEDHTIPALPAPPIYVQPKVLGVVEELMETAPPTSDAAIDLQGANDIQDMLETAWAYIADEEDPEMATSVGQYIGQVVSLYSTQMTNNMNDFNARVQEYTQEVKKVTSQAQMDRAKKDKQSDMNWQATQAQYTQDLAKHQADVALYQADINKQVQEWQMQNLTYKMAEWNSKVGHAIQEHSAETQNELNKFNEMDKLYQMKWTKAMQDATISQGNKANDLAEFDKAMNRYTQEVNTEVQRYQQDELLKKWELYKFDYQQALAEHGSRMTDAMNAFNSDNTKLTTEMTIAQGNANNIQAALMAQMQTDTELAKHNSMQQAQSDLNKFQQDLSNFQARLGKYTNDINTQQGEYSQVVAKYTQELANAMNTFNSDLQSKTKEYEWMQARSQQLEMEYNQGIGLLAQPKPQGE